MAVAGNRGGAGGARNIARAQRPPTPKPALPPNFPKAVPSRPGAITRPPAKPVKLPSRPRPSPVARAKAVERGYASQGRQVEKTATIQHEVSQAIQASRVRKRAKRVELSAQRKRIGYDRPIVVTHRERVETGRRAAEPYTTLGQAVEKRANLLNTANRLSRSTGDEHKVVGNQLYRKTHQTVHLPWKSGKGWAPVKTSGELDIGQASREAAVSKMETAAPVLKVLDQTMRPIHGIAGGARAAVRGENVAKATERGVKLKDRYLFSDVLKEAGVKGVPAAVAGTALDIAADPTTYATLGTGSVMRKSLREAAAQTERQALKAGFTETGAKTVAGQAARRAEEKVAAPSVARAERTAERRARLEVLGKKKAQGPLTRQQAQTVTEAGRKAGQRRLEQKGVTVRFATPTLRKGKHVPVRPGVKQREVPGIRRATAGATRLIRGGVRRVAPKTAERVPAKARGFVRHVSPATRPAGVTEAEHLAVRDLERKARAFEAHGRAKAEQLGRELDKMPAEVRAPVAHALDTGDLHRVHELAGEKVATLAREARDALRGARRYGERSGTIPRKRGEEWLSEAEHQKLGRRLAGEVTIQQRKVASAERHEAEAKGKAQIAETVGVERHRAGEKVATERARGTAATEQAKLRGKAGVVTEWVRGREAKRAAVAGERSVTTARQTRDQARLRLQTELRKPVAQRRGVPALEAKARAAERRLQTARSEVYPPAPVSATRPRVTPAPVEAEPYVTGRRAGKAAGRYEQRAATTQQAQRRVEAAKRLPTKGISETDETYLRRLAEYGRRHDLPLIVRRAEKRLSEKPAIPKGYYPREFQGKIERKAGVSREQVGGYATQGPAKKVSRITPGYQRAEHGLLEEVNLKRLQEGQEPFSTDVPLATMNYLKEVSRSAARGEFAKDLADIGRPVKSADDLRPGEGLYKLGFQKEEGRNVFGLHEVQEVPAKPTKGGQYVALNRDAVEGTKAASRAMVATIPAARALDRVQGVWKRRAIASLGYHVRNALGDLHQHYVAAGIPAHRIPANIAAGYRAGVRAGAKAKKLRPGETAGTITVAGKKTPVDDFLAMAARNGVLDAGPVRELRDLGAGGRERATRIAGRVSEKIGPIQIPGHAAAGRGASRAGRAIERWSNNRENMSRLATFKGLLDRGLTEREAAELANRIHIDYGDLSQTERVALRRIFPFYTWTARSIPVTAKAFVQHPGKFATLEKIREETGQAFTGESELEQRGRMLPGTARQVPLVVKIGGQPVALSFSAPSTLLNTMPTGLSSKQLGNWLEENRRFWAGMVGPVPRLISEAAVGTNIVTRKQIENSRYPLVSAPAWVKILPDELKRTLKVTPPKGKGKGGMGYTDPKTGKPTWAWRGRADWGYDQLMLGWYGQAAALAKSGRQPSQALPSTLAGIGGIRPDVLGEKESGFAKERRLRDERDKVDQRLNILRQQGIHKENATPEYQRLLDRYNAVNRRLNPPKKKKPGSLFEAPSGGGGGSLFDTPARSGGKSLFD